MEARYYTPREVAAHARCGELWVSCLGRVLDLTPLAREHRGDPSLRPLLDAAGSDISHWFDPETRDLLQRVDPPTGLRGYRAPGGPVPGVPPLAPRSDWVPPAGPPWWRDPRYEVCPEEPLCALRRRALPLNAHAGSYVFRSGSRELPPARPLGGPDEAPALRRLGLGGPRLLPGVTLRFADDFTER